MVKEAQTATEVYLVHDIGSSSVRCSAYVVPLNPSSDSVLSTKRSQETSTQVAAFCSLERQSVEPNAGTIRLYNPSSNLPPPLCDSSKSIDTRTSTAAGSGSLFDDIDHCIDETLKKLGLLHVSNENKDEIHQQYTVKAIGFSSFVMNLIGVTNDGSLVGEQATVSYACNSSQAATEVRQLESEIGEERLKELYQRTGAPLHTAYALPQLRAYYNKRNIDDQSSRRLPCKWQTIASICIARWTGEKTQAIPISYSEASWTGLFNFRTCRYDDLALALLPTACHAALPTVADNEEACYYLSSDKYVQRWPCLKNTPLLLGWGDGVAANVGSKCYPSPNRIACTIGTSAAARVCIYFPIEEQTDHIKDSGAKTDQAQKGRLSFELGLFCYRIDRNYVLVGGALTDGGSVVEWAMQLMNLSENKQLQDECWRQVEELLLEEDNTSSASLRVVPFLSGERSTGFRTGATGAIVGLTRATTSAHFLKACIEATTLRLRAIIDLIRKSCNTDGTASAADSPFLVVSGKALEVNATWRQMLCDCTGLCVVVDSDASEQGTSRGLARLMEVSLQRRSKQGTNSADNSAFVEEEEELCIKLQVFSRAAFRQRWDRMASEQEEFIAIVAPLFQ